MSPPFACEIADPDTQLMVSAGRGDDEAFAQLVRIYEPRIQGLMRSLVRAELAEDLTQEVFLRAYRRRSHYVPAALFSTWLYTIARNVASNARRTLARRHETRAADIAHDGPFASAHLDRMDVALTPPERVAVAESSQMVRLAIGLLSDRQRAAVEMFRFDNKSYSEIAKSMRTTQKAVKSLLSRARAHLRVDLAPYVQCD
ncbi:MAG: sigma-70 family RNA polymerase sigma factor [Pirellulaceae bacterium]|jgi:RNA polymerase sigma-70 factor (ECF subfamily)|nr:sigma-70 family RNA polymerase sigma factor [Pirellulaceae bacterium]MDP7014627.1 sigma-70 family RNA polymerase sigma factor [Pirellulaceae bacterium]